MTDTTHFLKRLKGIALSANERLQMRERLAMYSDMHPAVAHTPTRSFFTFIGSGRFSTYALTMVALLVLGSGITLAADGSVPGDSLYDIKIHVNEPVMTALATSPAGQARVAATLATRRVDEAVTLASRDELTAERQAYLSEQFDTRVKIAAKKADDLAQFDASAADNVKANLAANLANEAQALGAVGAEKKAEGNQFLQVVVATSESISDGANTSIAVATPVAGNQASTTIVAKGAAIHVEYTARSASTTASTTPSGLRSLVTGRFSKHLQVATSTLRARLASTTLNTAGVLTPRVDVAIPALPSMSGSETEFSESSTFHFGN